MQRRLALLLSAILICLGGFAFSQAAEDAAENPTESAEEGIPSFLLEDDAFDIEEGIWSDEFEDGRESTAWFVYDPGYFANLDVASETNPHLPHEEVTIYDEPINAEEVEGLLTIRGSLTPAGAAPEAAQTYEPTNLQRYKVISPDPIRGKFRAELKIALRGRSFGMAQVLFYVREHDWKFDGAREATLAITLANPPGEPTEVGYTANWNQGEYFDANLRFLGLEAQDNVIVQLRRTDDNQIQFWTAEDDAELEYRGRLGAPIETDIADILIGVNCTGGAEEGQTEGAITFDSFVIRGPEVPDVEEGTEDQSLVDLREAMRQDYELDSLGRFQYTKAALAANRAFTWMHFYGTNYPYPKNLLPFPPPDVQQFEVPPDGVEVTEEAKPWLHALLDQQTFPRNHPSAYRYLEQASGKYAEAAELDAEYANMSEIVKWVYEVAYLRIRWIMQVFRARTSNAPETGGRTLQGLQVVEANYDYYVGDDSFRNQWDPGITFFEGRLPSTVKSQAAGMPEPIALAIIQKYFNYRGEIRTPVDMVGRIPLNFHPDWMTIPLTLYVPDISQQVLARIMTAAMATQAGALGGGLAGPVGFPMQSMQSPTALFGGLDPTVMMGRGYTVVDYFGASPGADPDLRRIVRDELGRIDPKATAEKAFPYVRDFPGLTDVVAEILDPEKNGAAIIEWDFDLEALKEIETIPHTTVQQPEVLQPPVFEELFVESEVPLLANQNDPEIPRRFRLADYFGWDLDLEMLPISPSEYSHIAAFDSRSVSLSTSVSQ